MLKSFNLKLKADTVSSREDAAVHCSTESARGPIQVYYDTDTDIALA